MVPGRMARALLLSGGLSLLLLGTLAVIGLLVQGIAGIDRWEIPLGYRGWVLARYSQPDCPAAPYTAFTRVLRVSDDGRMCTSARLYTGWRQSLFEYVGADGSRVALTVGAPGREGNVWLWAADVHRQRELFFVGTEAEFRQDRTRPPLE